MAEFMNVNSKKGNNFSKQYGGQDIKQYVRGAEPMASLQLWALVGSL